MPLNQIIEFNGINELKDEKQPKIDIFFVR